MSARQLGFGDLHALPHARFLCTVGKLTLSSHDGQYIVCDDTKILFDDRDADTAIHTFLEAFFLKHNVAISVRKHDGFCIHDELQVSERWPDGFVELLAREFHERVLIEAEERSIRARDHRLDLREIDAKNELNRDTELHNCEALADECDANMIMGAAFVSVVGRESVSASMLDSGLWNDAWNLAKSHGYSNTWEKRS